MCHYCRSAALLCESSDVPVRRRERNRLALYAGDNLMGHEPQTFSDS